MSRLLAKLKGWRTVIVGVLVSAPLAVLEILEQLQFVDSSFIFPEPWGQRVALGLALLMILLRLVTSGPVGRSE
jgi:hypothetical protein